MNEPRGAAERLEAIDNLHCLYDEGKYGQLIRSDDAFLLRFLRAKKFNLDKALKCLQNYHKIRHEMPEVFAKVNHPNLLKNVIASGVLYIGDKQLKNGARVVIYRTGLIPSHASILDIMAYGILCVECMLEDEEYQICGHVLIEDFNGFNIGKMTQLSPLSLKKMNSVWQDCLPVRYKLFHVINEGTVFDIAFALVKPFLKEKMVKRIKLHGKNYEESLVDIDRELLPPYMGGTGPDPTSVNSAWCEKLASMCSIGDLLL